MKASLSRQVSAASCSSAQLHLRNLHQKWMMSHLGKQQAAGSPDQPARSHLDDDGMPVYTDVIQQRLRQIETGHQQEVETLKKQVQELKSRLESQFLNSSLRLNGDYGDEVVSEVVTGPLLETVGYLVSASPLIGSPGLFGQAGILVAVQGLVKPSRSL